MVYRIRYNQATGTEGSEARIEAHSPTEAMVKFQHTHPTHIDNRNRPQVTSIQAEDHPDRTDRRP